MNELLAVFGLVVLIWVVYKLMNHKDKSTEQTEQPVAEPKVVETKPEPPKCGCGRSPTGYCVGLHKLSDAEWAISDKNPNRVEVAPVVVTADTPATPVAETAEAPVAKKPRAKKAATADKKPRAKKAK